MNATVNIGLIFRSMMSETNVWYMIHHLKNEAGKRRYIFETLSLPNIQSSITQPNLLPYHCMIKNFSSLRIYCTDDAFPWTFNYCKNVLAIFRYFWVLMASYYWYQSFIYIIVFNFCFLARHWVLSPGDTTHKIFVSNQNTFSGMSSKTSYLKCKRSPMNNYLKHMCKVYVYLFPLKVQVLYKYFN